MKDGRYAKSLPNNIDYSLTERERFVRAAALIDGEGCIIVVKLKTSFEARIQVASTTPILLLWLQGNFGGSIYEKIHHGNRKPCFMWKISAANGDIFLRQIEPYLLIKQPQALNAIEFRKLQVANYSLLVDKRHDLSGFHQKSMELNDSARYRKLRGISL